jgi:hypothetical protein
MAISSFGTRIEILNVSKTERKKTPTTKVLFGIIITDV